MSRRMLGVGLFAMALSVAQWRMVTLIVNLSYMLGGMTFAVLEGHAEWYVWQNRILGPLAIKLLGGDLDAYRNLTIAMLTVSALLAYRLAGMRGMLVMELGFALLICHAYCPWDIFELPIFLTFVLLVVEDASLLWFAALYAVAMLNRQSAQFIALYLVVNPLVRYIAGRRPLHGASIGLGIICGATGMIVTESICRFMGRKPDPIYNETGNLFHYRLIDNIFNDMNPYRGGWLRMVDHNAMPLLLWVIVAAIIAAIALLVRRDPVRFGALAIVYFVMLAAALTFGIARETRNWIPFIPLAVVAASDYISSSS